MRKDKEEAIKLRLSGNSYSQINKILNVPKSTLSVWLKNLILDEATSSKIEARGNALSIQSLVKRNKQQTEIANKRHQTIKNKAELEAIKYLKDPLFIAGVSLYWAEGYKKGWDKSIWKTIDFTNSDPEMIKLMINFFTKFLKTSKNDIKIQIMGHEDANIEKYINFWHNLTGVRKENFFKPFLATSKSSKKKSKSRLEYGTIHLRINRIESFFRLYGWMEALKKKII